MIRFDNVFKTYDSQYDALRNISLEIDQGEFIFVTGHSGAGKSTFMRLIARVDIPTRGQLIVDGQNLNRLSAIQVAAYRRRVGYIFQEGRLFPHLTVLENLTKKLILTLEYSEFKTEVKQKQALIPAMRNTLEKYLICTDSEEEKEELLGNIESLHMDVLKGEGGVRRGETRFARPARGRSRNAISRLIRTSAMNTYNAVIAAASDTAKKPE